MSDIAVAALLAGTILLASTVSVEIGISVALIELLLGVVVGNAFRPRRPELAQLHRLVRRHRADLPRRRRGRRAAVPPRVAGVALDRARQLLRARSPSSACSAYYALDWTRRQAEIGGLALSTTSLAVVYAVLVETGLNRELVGKRLMSATFVTDIATVVGLTVLFIKPTIWIVPFVLVSVALIVGLPKIVALVLLPLRRPRDRARDQARLRRACSC